jgi:NAD(P)-dependent dehydrogenase (short-subunit alcohol dehydrogenase family)
MLSMVSNSIHTPQKKKVLVTGASSGIGLITAKRLAERGAEVLLLCRDQRKGEDALQLVARSATAAGPSLYIADLSCQKSIRLASASLIEQHDCLDVLINNAGALFAKRELTNDGIEKTFATNHLAPFLLTALLMPLMRNSQAARIVTVASRVHASTIDWDNLQGERRYSAMEAYGRSKLENILFTYELARRLGAASITANCLSPGLVRTNLGRGAGGIVGLMPRLLALTPLCVTPEEGAKTSIYLASSPHVKSVTGGYFYRCKQVKSKPISYDPSIAQKLWKISEEKALPRSAKNRIALPVAGDDRVAKQTVLKLVDAMGFDAVDAGSLSQSWRQQPGTPAYCSDPNKAELQALLARADRNKAPVNRDLAARILAKIPTDFPSEDLVRFSRLFAGMDIFKLQNYLAAFHVGLAMLRS